MAIALAELINKMTRLHKLEFQVPKSHICMFAVEFQHFGVLLPSVKTLVAALTCEFLIELCPNVTYISTNGYTGDYPGSTRKEEASSFFKATKTATKLAHLTLRRYWMLNLGMKNLTRRAFPSAKT